MNRDTYPIKGIPVKPGAPLPLRYEVTQWYNNPRNKLQISLFMQALTKLMEVPIDQRISFFQIGGIHCYPLVSWDGEDAVPEPLRPTDPFPGYCAHNRVTFPSWHRVYNVLFEQAVYEHMIDLIKKWQLPTDEESQWLEAATQWRLPYWDWARIQSYCNGFGVPYVCTLETVEIVIPGGSTKEIPNPLARFTNPTKVDGKNVPMGDKVMGINAIKDNKEVKPGWEPLPWSKCIGTSRYGILSDVPSEKWAKGINNWKESNAGIANPPWDGQGAGNSFADAVSRLFSPGYFDSFESFSSTIRNDPATATNYFSLEYIHNIVHNATGGLYMNAKEQQGNAPQGIGLGHMADVPVAGFDPLFWLHHCNVDRLFAMWQTLNPDVWFNKPDHKEDPAPTDPLLPFHFDTRRGHWTSDSSRYWTSLNYEFDTLVPHPNALHADGNVNREQHTTDLRATINELYPSTSQLVKATAGYSIDDDTKFHDYIINIIYDRYALKGRSYSILFFLGDPPKNLSGYNTHPGYLGQVYSFSAPIEVDGAVACSNCSSQGKGKILSTGQVPITIPLLSKALLTKTAQANGNGNDQSSPLGIPNLDFGALDPDSIEKVLGVALKWIFVEIGGQILSPRDFPDTEIAVMRGEGQHNLDRHQLPVFSGYRKMESVTKSHLLGSGNDDPHCGLNLIRNDAGY